MRVDSGGQRRDTIGRRGCRGQMFKSCLDPFNRTAGFARGQSHQHDVWKHCVLRAEAAAGIGRRLEAQPVRWHAERQCHDRVHRQRALEIRGDLVGVFARQMLGGNDKGFERRAGIARIARRNRNAVRRGGECRFGFAIAKCAIADDVGANRRMQQWRIRRGRRLRINDGRQGPVFDRDPFECVFSDIAILR
jgi:hypothetical protein